MIIMMAVGWFITKRGMITEKGTGEITKILLNIVTPCLIVSSFLSVESGSISGWSLALSVVTAASCTYCSAGGMVEPSDPVTTNDTMSPGCNFAERPAANDLILTEIATRSDERSFTQWFSTVGVFDSLSAST